MRKDKNPALAEHFEKLKAILPEVYRPKANSESEKLLGLLKNSLTVIEAVYLQHPESFSTARYDAYSHIISELSKMGYCYKGNEDLIQRATNDLLVQARLPMERVGKKNTSTDSIDKKAM